MDAIDTLLNTLLERKTSLAMNLLEVPVGNDGYAYGISVGAIRGLNIAIEALKEQLSDAKEKSI